MFNLKLDELSVISHCSIVEVRGFPKTRCKLETLMQPLFYFSHKPTSHPRRLLLQIFICTPAYFPHCLVFTLSRYMQSRSCVPTETDSAANCQETPEQSGRRQRSFRPSELDVWMAMKSVELITSARLIGLGLVKSRNSNGRGPVYLAMVQLYRSRIATLGGTCYAHDLAMPDNTVEVQMLGFKNGCLVRCVCISCI